MGTRVLTPEGRIVRVLLDGEVLSPVEIIKLSGVPRATTYSNLKDLLIVGWIVEREGRYALTPEGVMAYLSEVLPDDVDVSRLISIARSAGTSPARLVSLGVRIDRIVYQYSYRRRNIILSDNPDVLNTFRINTSREYLKTRYCIHNATPKRVNYIAEMPEPYIGCLGHWGSPMEPLRVFLLL